MSTQSIILSPISFDPDARQVAGGLTAENRQGFERVLEKARAVARPQAMYRPVSLSDRGENWVAIEGIRLLSRVLRINLENSPWIFLYAASCGPELAAWAEEESMPEAWRHRIQQSALKAALDSLADRFQEYTPVPQSDMKPGSLEDWPMAELAKLFALLGDPETAIGLRRLDSGFMDPPHSVAGIRFYSQPRFESCMLCPMKECPLRKFDPDPDLARERFGMTLF